MPAEFLLKNLNVILVRAENPVNIGQSARAMKNFGASKLILVNCAPHKVDEAYTPGWKGRKILDAAKTPRSLKAALKGCILSIGFTTRSGTLRGESSPFQERIPQIVDMLKKGRVCFVFGNEKNGLSNEELAHCQLLARIPANPEYTSLNLSHAVAVSLSAVFAQLNAGKRGKEESFPSDEEFKDFVQDLRKTLEFLGYRNFPKNKLLDNVHSKMAHYFRKTAMDKRELHLFRSFWGRIKKQNGSPGLPQKKPC